MSADKRATVAQAPQSAGESQKTSGRTSVECDRALEMVTSADIKDFLARLVQERDEARTAPCESTNVVPNSTQPEGAAKWQSQRTHRVRKLRKTPVKNSETTTKTTVGELIRQPHGGALRRGNPGNRGGGRPSHAVKQVLCGDLEVMHERIVSRLNDPSLRFTDLLDLFGEVLTRLERYGF